MKTYLSIILILSLIATGCGNSEKADSEKEKSELLEGSEVELKEADSCEEFIDQYEEWMDNYLVFLEKYMKNPTDSKIANDYMKLAQEGSHWMSQWTTKLYHCADDEGFEKRFDEISAKADKKMKELGFE